MEHPSADKAAANAAAQPAQSTDTKLKPVSYVSLFRYATWVDVAMLVAACLCAMANGIVFPLFSLIMSGLLDSFFANDIMSTVGAYALYMLYIAIASLVLSLVQIGVAMIQAERQGIRIRDAYLRAILRQEAGYHDTHDMGEVSTRISGDVLNIVAGMGEKAHEWHSAWDLLRRWSHHGIHPRLGPHIGCPELGSHLSARGWVDAIRPGQAAEGRTGRVRSRWRRRQRSDCRHPHRRGVRRGGS